MITFAKGRDSYHATPSGGVVVPGPAVDQVALDCSHVPQGPADVAG